MVFMFEKNLSQIEVFSKRFSVCLHGYSAMETYYKAYGSLSNMKFSL